MKDVYATEEASSPQNKSSNTAKHKVLLFLFECIVFALLDQDLANQNQCGSMRIRIHNTGCKYARQFYGKKKQCKYNVPIALLQHC
jgi:hypothetical protein